MLDAKGHRTKYDRKSLEAMARKKEETKRANIATGAARMAHSRGFVPAGGQTQQPFWQYAIFGSGIGASNIVIDPMPQNGAPEIVIGGNSTNGFGADDFWQVLRHNSATGNYDQVFVSPLYRPREGESFVAVTRIGLRMSRITPISKSLSCWRTAAFTCTTSLLRLN